MGFRFVAALLDRCTGFLEVTQRNSVLRYIFIFKILSPQTEEEVGWPRKVVSRSRQKFPVWRTPLLKYSTKNMTIPFTI